MDHCSVFIFFPPNQQLTGPFDAASFAVYFTLLEVICIESEVSNQEVEEDDGGSVLVCAPLSSKKPYPTFDRLARREMTRSDACF